MLRRVPLAWLNLTHDKRRLVVSVLGVAFAVFLMFVELGFWNALLDGCVQLIDEFNGQLIVVNTGRYALNIREPFPRDRLEQARTVPGVQAAFPVYLEYVTSLWRDPDAPEDESTNRHPIRVIAFDPDRPVLNNAEVERTQTVLKLPYTVLLDRKSKPSEYGTIEPGIERELAGHRVRVADMFVLGTDFTSNGSVVMSDQTFARLFGSEREPSQPLALADVGVVQVQSGADLVQVRDALREALPPDVEVYTRDEFAQKEMDYWERSTPIGFIFRFGLFMGFIVGAVICYQIISTDVADHLAEFATLKAVGYPDGYLNQTVLRETLWLSGLGFLPGLGLSWLLYRVLDAWIGLPMRLNERRILLVLGLTVAMCVLSGLLALRKVKSADPAEVF